MSNIHNNSILASSSISKGMKPGEAQNESNGMGSAGYFVVEGGYEQEPEQQYVDRSALLMDALSGLATINHSRLYVQKNIMKKATRKYKAETRIA